MKLSVLSAVLTGQVSQNVQEAMNIILQKCRRFKNEPRVKSTEVRLPSSKKY